MSMVGDANYKLHNCRYSAWARGPQEGDQLTNKVSNNSMRVGSEPITRGAAGPFLVLLLLRALMWSSSWGDGFCGDRTSSKFIGSMSQNFLGLSCVCGEALDPNLRGPKASVVTI